MCTIKCHRNVRNHVFNLETGIKFVLTRFFSWKTFINLIYFLNTIFVFFANACTCGTHACGQTYVYMHKQENAIRCPLNHSLPFIIEAVCPWTWNLVCFDQKNYCPEFFRFCLLSAGITWWPLYPPSFFYVGTGHPNPRSSNWQDKSLACQSIFQFQTVNPFNFLLIFYSSRGKENKTFQNKKKFKV